MGIAEAKKGNVSHSSSCVTPADRQTYTPKGVQASARQMGRTHWHSTSWNTMTTTTSERKLFQPSCKRTNNYFLRLSPRRSTGAVLTLKTSTPCWVASMLLMKPAKILEFSARHCDTIARTLARSRRTYRIRRGDCSGSESRGMVGKNRQAHFRIAKTSPPSRATRR